MLTGIGKSCAKVLQSVWPGCFWPQQWLLFWPALCDCDTSYDNRIEHASELRDDEYYACNLACPSPVTRCMYFCRVLQVCINLQNLPLGCTYVAGTCC